VTRATGPGTAATAARFRAAIICLLLLAGGLAAAQECTWEAEPNDTPASATLITGAGPDSGLPPRDGRLTTACIAGEMSGNDQDAFLWEISEAGAGQQWLVDLEGIPGHLTRLDIISVTFADNGTDVTAKKDLLSLGTPDGRPVTSQGFLMAPGRYIIGLSKSGGAGRYVAHLRPAQALLRHSREYSTDRGQASEFSVTGSITGEITQGWTVSEEDAGFVWSVRLEAALGSQPELILHGPAGRVASVTTDAAGNARLDSLALQAGAYSIEVKGDSGAFRLGTSRQGRAGEGIELEPNNSFATATRFPPDSEMRGSISDPDYFRIPVDEAAAARAWNLHLEASDNLNLELRSEDGRRLLRRQGASGTIGQLVLSTGDYQLRIDGSRGTDYTLALRPAERPAAGWETEPNDTAFSATPLGPDGQVRGELSAQDVDMFRLELDGEAQLYRVQAVGSGVTELSSHNGAAELQASVRGEKRLRLDNLALLPGTHYLSVKGTGGEYALRVLPLGPLPAAGQPADPAAPAGPLTAAAAPAAEQPAEEAAAAPAAALLPVLPPPPPGLLELEPNDDYSRADVLQPGVTRVGTLSSAGDTDHYRFHLAADQYVRIELVPPAGSQPLPFHLDSVGWIETRDAEPGTPTIMERWLLAGDHRVQLRRGETPGTYYQLRLSQLNSALLPVDAEPNDTRETAGRLPATLTWTGRVGEQANDYDTFVLPLFDLPATVTVSIDSNNASVRAEFLTEDAYLQPEHDRENASWTADLPAGQQNWLQLRGSGPYTASLEFSSPPDPAWLLPDQAEPEVTITLDTPVSDLAAYWHEGQTVTATARITNDSATEQTVELNAAASDARLQVELPAAIQLGAGQSSELPVRLDIPADLRHDLPLVFSLAASSQAGSSGATLTFAAACEASPLGPVAWWPVPRPLLGSVDMLWDALGAGLHADSPHAGRDRSLLDGRTSPASGGFLYGDHSPTFVLAGTESVELTGALLHPQSDAATGQQLKRFRIETSLDGLTFTPALEGELLAARIEQAFVFETPVKARYARIVYLSSQGGENGAYLGEVKLLAREPAPLGALNLADLALGGHIIWSEPLLSGRGQGMLTPGSRAERLDLRDHDELTFVLGFRNGRAAQLTRIEWLDSAETLSSSEAVPAVTIEASLTSPVGPWLELADWTLQRAADGRAVLDFTEPVTARYLRFSAPVPPETRYLRVPQELRVLEREADGEYLSALGEWGHGSRDGIIEYLEPASTAGRMVSTGDNATRATALPLASGEVAEGTVLVGEDVDWYRLTIGPGQNHLTVRLSGEPVISYDYSLEDAAGQPVAYDLSQSGEEVVLSLYGEPGDFWLKLEEPKRTVVFSWDTSGSMGPYQTITYNALAGFAREVDGSREAVQLLAFDDPGPRWLLPIWSSDTERVQRAVNDFDRNADSSNSESALLTATRALAGREGTRAILLVTDAETSGYSLTPALWRQFEAVQPRIFTFEVSSGGSLYSQQLMQDWAAVNHGHYDLATSVGDLDAGFSRASCILRRPKHYRIEVPSGSAALPGPGSLSVRRPAGAAQPAVEIIFDASGSMGRELPSGEQRITAAKRVLESLVTEVLPEGAPFALRAFGHIKPSSCETRLDIRFGPLDRTAALAAVRAIEPKLLSQTPLADSLAAVGDDLAQAGRSRTVILITDGEESCGGDPVAAVRESRARHPLDLAIVSLGLEDEEQRRFEELAEAVGASYVDVTSFEELKASVDNALNPEFEVLDASGEPVARGLVDGAAVELEMGVYTVRVHGMPVQEFRDVRVPGEKVVLLEFGGQ
jgi:Mg-chelatase subunit ChlD